MITETLRPSLAGVTVLSLGSGLSWSDLLIRALEKIPSSTILFTLEDFFLRDKVDTDEIKRLLAIFENDNLSMLRLITRPGPDLPYPTCNRARLGLISNNAPYKVSTQAAFWSVKTLRSILAPGESIWEFEMKGSERAKVLPGFACVKKSIFPYRHHVIERGKWFPWEAKKFNAMKIGVDLTKRQVMSNRETFRWCIGKTKAPLMIFLVRVCVMLKITRKNNLT